MKIPGSISTPVYQPPSPSVSKDHAGQSGTIASGNFSSPTSLHASGSGDVSSLASFRDPAALDARKTARADGFSQVKHAVTQQFGHEIASMIFNSPTQQSGGETLLAHESWHVTQQP